jgi:hypothetical protein
MTIKNALFTFCLFGYIIFTGLACATQDNASTGVKMTQNILEADFSVIDKKVMAKKGGEDMCKSDNENMLSALQVKKISLSDHDYHVIVSKKEYEFPALTEENKLELFHYEISLLAEQSADNQFSALKNKEYLETRIPRSKAPTSCYIFTRDKKLNLICHYGFKKYSSMSYIINDIKQH